MSAMKPTAAAQITNGESKEKGLCMGVNLLLYAHFLFLVTFTHLHLVLCDHQTWGKFLACYTNHPTLRDSLIGRARNWDGLSGLAQGHGQVIRSELYRHDGRHWMIGLGGMLPGL
jgi:hypothetical protein